MRRRRCVTTIDETKEERGLARPDRLPMTKMLRLLPSLPARTLFVVFFVLFSFFTHLSGCLSVSRARLACPFPLNFLTFFSCPLSASFLLPFVRTSYAFSFFIYFFLSFAPPGFPSPEGYLILPFERGRALRCGGGGGGGDDADPASWIRTAHESPMSWEGRIRIEHSDCRCGRGVRPDRSTSPPNPWSSAWLLGKSQKPKRRNGWCYVYPYFRNVCSGIDRYIELHQGRSASTLSWTSASQARLELVEQCEVLYRYLTY